VGIGVDVFNGVNVEVGNKVGKSNAITMIAVGVDDEIEVGVCIATVAVAVG